VWRYGIALLLVALAFVTRLALDPVLGTEHQPYATFYVSVAVTAWWCGLGPALFSLGAGLLLSLYAIVPPRDSFLVMGRRDLAEVVIHLLVSGTIVLLMELLRLAQQRTARLLRQAQEGQRQLAADIVDRLKAEEALHQARQQLAEANAGLERTVQERTAKMREAMGELEHFSYSIVHDMRAPLRAMQSYAAFLEEEAGKCALGAEGHEFIRRIRVAARRMDLLITDALTYSQVVREELALKPVDLRRLLASLIHTYPNLQAHAEQIHLAPSLPLVLGNEAALTQCFGNLLDNALKFVAPGRPPRVEVLAKLEEGWVRVCVQDNGIGIPKAAQARLFRMFERLHRGYEGTGIGLALVRKVAERMGGRVGVESEPGQGSCFWVELRRATLPSLESPRALDSTTMATC
jgi:signal transduction histidine kinase